MLHILTCPCAYTLVWSTLSDKVGKVSTGTLECISLNENALCCVLKITMALTSCCQMTELIFRCTAMLGLTFVWNGGADMPIKEAIRVTKECH